ncbi:hypothetical protein EV702DRAFT_1249632 [Suillus placidus]|uniref:Uncharacterized protein n=1 Tax=Suillus placidus TaxID=48579 RepID=A0A9P7CYX8_9AGAM|nr:hypothetical protein EV702DRAFT_1249632 [Suillus placidus]
MPMRREVAREFLALLAVCHMVIPEVRDGKIHYQASSPDEAALVAGVEMLGYQFHTHKPHSVFLSINNTPAKYEILNVCEFNSTTVRSSFSARVQTLSFSSILLRTQAYTEKTLIHLKHLKSILLAIGDGANNMSMIQAAHVGMGISGVEVHDHQPMTRTTDSAGSWRVELSETVEAHPLCIYLFLSI